ncbi:hypothetical protein CF386_09270 [Paraphotobacterium marinum]|uniref:Uncharacterized protein n=1 Tax=Paraphotobacterium marinum TaxID=1755811 RepID=A0A220VG29_9GAMM|nr:hypothetical protein [Paraphotobacterium marinum]ASK79251.1 hypothetical protein CF386_09270 [Paraphotobacterium marinum]
MKKTFLASLIILATTNSAHALNTSLSLSLNQGDSKKSEVREMHNPKLNGTANIDYTDIFNPVYYGSHVSLLTSGEPQAGYLNFVFGLYSQGHFEGMTKEDRDNVCKNLISYLNENSRLFKDKLDLTYSHVETKDGHQILNYGEKWPNAGKLSSFNCIARFSHLSNYITTGAYNFAFYGPYYESLNGAKINDFLTVATGTDKYGDDYIHYYYSPKTKVRANLYDKNGQYFESPTIDELFEMKASLGTEDKDHNPVDLSDYAFEIKGTDDSRAQNKNVHKMYPDGDFYDLVNEQEEPSLWNSPLYNQDGNQNEWGAKTYLPAGKYHVYEVATLKDDAFDKYHSYLPPADDLNQHPTNHMIEVR